jgi:ornithine--oxo-acid transaminase
MYFCILSIKKYFIMEQTLQGLSPAETLIEKENKYGAHNYHPLPVVLDRRRVLFGMWTVRNIMILSAYSAVNQGHCHPKIVGAMIKQAQTLTLTFVLS